MKKLLFILCLSIILIGNNVFGAQDFSLLAKKIMELENGINSITNNYQSNKSYNLAELQNIKDELYILRAKLIKQTN